VICAAAARPLRFSPALERPFAAPTQYSIGSAFPIGSMLARNFALKFRKRAITDANGSLGM
jgi:hypothetical protein